MINISPITAAFALAMCSTHAPACEPRAAVAVAIADEYASRIKPEAKVRVSPSAAEIYAPMPRTLARLTLGMDCGMVAIYAEHLSSIDTGRDTGINTINVEVDLLDLFDSLARFP